MNIVSKNSVCIAFASLFLATPVLADETNTVYGKVASGYLLKDVGITASSHIVFQNGFTHSFGKVSTDVWVSTGPEGSTADEIDGSLYYNDTLGLVRVELSGQYYAINMHNSLLDSRDDLVVLYADLSVPVTRGRVTIAPVFRAVERVGIHDLPTQTLVQPGVRVAVQAADQLALSAEVRDSISVTRHYSTLMWTTGLSYRFTKHLSGELGLEGTSRTEMVGSIGFRYHF